MELKVQGELELRSGRQRWWICSIVIVLLLEVAVVSFLSGLQSHWRTADSPKYLLLAEGISKGYYGILWQQLPALTCASAAGQYQVSESARNSVVPEAVRPPLYPVYLWLILKVLKMPEGAAVFGQLLMYLGAVLILAKTLLKAGLSPLPFLALTAFYPFAIGYASVLMTEGLTILLLAMCIYVIANPLPLSMPRACALGALSGALILVRADQALIPVVLLGTILWRGKKSHAPFRANLASCGVLIVTTVVLLLPYAYLNYENFGLLTPMPPGGALGNSLYLATWEKQLQPEDLSYTYSGKFTSAARQAGLEKEIATVNRSVAAPENTPLFNPECYVSEDQMVKAGKLLRSLALKRIRLEPARYIQHVATSWFRLFVTASYPSNISATWRAMIMGWASLIWALGIWGAYLVLRNAAKMESLVGAVVLFAYYPAVHCFLHTEARYTAAARLPMLMLGSVVLQCILMPLPLRRPSRRSTSF